jgi:hypothetical protein
MNPDWEELRKRLSRMNDDALKRFGTAVKYRCAAENGFRQPPRREFVLQLIEARAEWTRRYPDSTVEQSF